MLDINKAYGVMHSIRETGSIEGAAALNGISATTYYNWMRHGKRMTEWEAQGNRLDPEDEPFAILYRNVNETLAQIELTNYEIVKQAAGAGIWQAAAWVLERRFPERWGRRSGGGRVPIEIRADSVSIRPQHPKTHRESSHG